MRGKAVFVAALAFLFCPKAEAAEHSRILWMVSGQPPAFIAEPPMAHQGYGDLQLDFLTHHLPDFEHQIITAPLNRIWFQIGQDDAICTVVAGKTAAREAVGVFSQRPFWSVTNRLVARKRDLARFLPYVDEQGMIDLGGLAHASGLTGAYDSGGSYGPQIDGLIADPTRSVIMTPQPKIRTPLRMLAESRINFFFAYEMQVRYYRTLDKLDDEFIYFPIKGDPSHYDAFVACANKPIGRQMIAAVDKLLEDKANMSAFLDSLKNWYGPQDFALARAAAGLK
jgi:uncharacterized protein (TIGR02285 family)